MVTGAISSAMPTPPDEMPGLGPWLQGLFQERWRIAGATLVALLLGVLYVVLTPPLFESEAVLQVEGAQPPLPGFEQFAASEAPQAETEIALITSRTVLGAVVDQRRLQVEAVPLRFLFIGGAVARGYHGEGPAPPLFGLQRYGWGGESIVVEALELPATLEGVPLRLVAEAQGTFEVRGPDERPIARGRAGESLALGEGNERFAIQVTSLKARPGTEFLLWTQPRLAAIADLQRHLAVSERGRRTGILELRLQGHDPAAVAQTLQAICTTYLRQNLERRHAQVQKTLALIEQRLPLAEARLETAERALNAWRSQVGRVEPSLDARTLLEESAEVRKELTRLDLQRSDLEQKFTADHPAREAVARQRASLEARQARLAERIQALPAQMQEEVGRERDARAAADLLASLRDKRETLQLLAAGVVGTVRSVDEASYPFVPIRPRPFRVLALATLAGFMLAVAWVTLRGRDGGVHAEPEQWATPLGLPVLAIVPHAKSQSTFGSWRRDAALLAAREGSDPTVESLRHFRTALLFALRKARNNVVVVSGARPGGGKSFIAANIAFLLAAANKRTLVIDADLRKGRLHRLFGVTGLRNGLAEWIRGATTGREAIRPTAWRKLYLLPGGVTPANPSELLLSPRFEWLLTRLATKFDVVVVDTPPVREVADATIVGRLAGTNIIVVRHGDYSVPEVARTLQRFRQNGIEPNGLVFNDLPVHPSNYPYYGYGHRASEVMNTERRR